MTALAILDLGYGNTRSVALAFERLGETPVMTADAAVAAAADQLVLPGVGAARSAMEALRRTGLDRVVSKRSRPTLGICLGMQLMFEESEEDGGQPLLALVPGAVTALVPSPAAPVPNMGWCALEDVAPGLGLGNGDQLYFAHGFACADGPATVARFRHGDRAFPAAVRTGAMWGAQFHPERSSAVGARFLSAFLKVMILLPAIDLVGGRCVRLAQGDFGRETDYSTDPVTALAGFAASGAAEAHLVDLDGAKARAPRQHDMFCALAETSGLALQVAGGFRTADQVARVLDAGVSRVVIGSLALDDPASFDGLLERFGPDRLVLALDVRVDGKVPMVATHGWTTDSGQSLDTVLARFARVRHLLVTDIARDGMLAGPNLPLMRSLADRYRQIALQASGGVARLDDLSRLNATGAARAIVGKAIWENRFSVAEGVAYARG